MKIPTLNLKVAFLFLLIFSPSCNTNLVNPMILGEWKSEKIESSDIGLVSFTFVFEENKEFLVDVCSDTGEVMSFSGSFNIEDNYLYLHSKKSVIKRGGEIVYKEEIDVVQKSELVSLDSNNLVLRELSGSSEELVSFQRVTKGEPKGGRTEGVRPSFHDF